MHNTRTPDASRPEAMTYTRTWRAWMTLLGGGNERAAFSAALQDGSAAALLGPWIGFGTAGIRAPRGPGKEHFNQATLSAVALAVVRTLRKPGARVVLGCDARLGGHAAMVACAERLAHAGAHTLWLPKPAPTPFVAFLTRHLSADLGIMVTASHNPAAYNGAKFFDREGAQLDDQPATEASAWLHNTSLEAIAVELVGTSSQESDSGAPVASRTTFNPKGSAQAITDAAFSASADHYVAHIKHTLAAHASSHTRSIAVTPLQGVGGVWLERTLAGESDSLDFVAAEREPDGTFAAVSSPNPEVSSALDPLRQKLTPACQLGLALDPDADRLAVVELQPLTGEVRTFQGNEIGLLLATFASWSPSTALTEASLDGCAEGDRPIVLTTVVSSAGLEAAGARMGFEVLRSGTGFRRVTALKRGLGARAHHVVLSFEEALGFALGPETHDKDGLQAALALLRARAYFQQTLGTNLLGTLRYIDEKAGCWRSTSRSVALHSKPWASDAREVKRRMACAGSAVAALLPGAPEHPVVEPLSVMAHPLAGDCGPGWNMRLGVDGRVALRSSGTEPKLKLYFDRRYPEAEDNAARTAVGDLADKFSAAFLAA